MALIGHRDGVEECPLLGVKQTSKFKSVTSTFDPKRTSGGSFRLTLKSAELEALYTAAGRLMIMPTAFTELE